MWSPSPSAAPCWRSSSRYERYVSILKWTTLSLFAYVATALVVDAPWGQVAYSTFVPSLILQKDYIVAIVAVLGTTITPYCFFWQSSQEAEDERVDPAAHRLIDAPGPGFSNLISLFIIITTAATLNAHGITDIQTSAQAAEALRPIAGVFTFAVFAAGIIGIGLLAVPVLAGSAAYALGEGLGWTTGLGRLPTDAKAFYGTIAIAKLIGMFINFVGIDPIKALFWAAVLNGVVAVPLMVVIMTMAHAEAGNGGVHRAAAALGNGLVVDRGDGCRRRGDVSNLVNPHTQTMSQAYRLAQATGAALSATTATAIEARSNRGALS